VRAILKVLVDAERGAVKGYPPHLQHHDRKRPPNYDLVLSILNEEIEYESWFAEFLVNPVWPLSAPS
jgi:ferritin-like protein